MKIDSGDIVVRKSYGKDIYFKVVEIDSQKEIAILKGMDLRLWADAPLHDLEKPGLGELANYRTKSLRLRIELTARAARRQKRSNQTSKKKSGPDYVEIPGKVLHLDGDAEYLGICKRVYEDLRIENYCVHVPEEAQPQRVLALLQEYNPDILVLTGHDGIVKKSAPDNVENYRTTRYFIDAVHKARHYQSSKDDLVIFAGACQSWYQGLIRAGANFASSPQRVLIHCLDPVFIVEKVAFTPVNRTVSIYDVLTESITGLQGVGGIESRGQFRLGLPKLK